MSELQPFKTIIIDDEEPARLRLKQLLSGNNHIFIIGEARNGNEAIEMINMLKPDLIFLDIQMPGKDGFEVIQHLDHMPYIIFCTAYDQYALKAFETNSIDYIIKPVKKERLEIALTKVENLRGKTDYSIVLKMVENMVSAKQKNIVTSLPVKVGDRVVFVKIDEIAFLEASDKYVQINTIHGKQLLLDQSLTYLEEKLPDQFLRIQRGVIINTQLIKEIKRYLGSKYSIILDDLTQTRIITGRNYAETIQQLLKF